MTSENQHTPRFEPFSCLRCGNCCTGEGYVNLTQQDCNKLAEFLNLDLKQFYEQYTIHKPGYYRCLTDGDGENQPCIFLDYDEMGLSLCKVQGPAKPQQCVDFPRKWSLPDADKWCAGLIAEKMKREHENVS